MASLKGSRTEKNLLAAFAGESQTRTSRLNMTKAYSPRYARNACSTGKSVMFSAASRTSGGNSWSG